MTSFVDCDEIVFRGTFVILLCAAFVGVVCFAISLSYRLKLRYVIPELLCALCAVTTFCFCRTVYGFAISVRAEPVFQVRYVFVPRGAWY